MKTTTINVACEQGLRDRVDRAARLERIRTSEYVRRAVAEAADRTERSAMERAERARLLAELGEAA